MLNLLKKFIKFEFKNKSFDIINQDNDDFSNDIDNSFDNKKKMTYLIALILIKYEDKISFQKTFKY